ncbi:DUF389 domain-containing protein [Nonomuraea diastatica]|uniref:DUF389 domain-containing protein n=1 Tax=Nonomuraea diastatica TaxID=1848329 RepID=UPI0015F2CB1D|nr:DUF389 domain-containing protein [Nonomuraea diastatica]
MLHLRLISPPSRADEVTAVLEDCPGVTNIVVLSGAARLPSGISVTTVPAAGYLAVALALGQWAQVAGSVSQLSMNVAGMIVAGPRP